MVSSFLFIPFFLLFGNTTNFPLVFFSAIDKAYLNFARAMDHWTSSVSFFRKQQKNTHNDDDDDDDDDQSISIRTKFFCNSTANMTMFNVLFSHLLSRFIHLIFLCFLLFCPHITSTIQIKNSDAISILEWSLHVRQGRDKLRSLARRFIRWPWGNFGGEDFSPRQDG